MECTWHSPQKYTVWHCGLCCGKIKVFPIFNIFQIADDQKVAPTPTAHCCCGVDSLAALVTFGVPAQKGQRQQRRVCATRGVDSRRIRSAICGICWAHASREAASDSSNTRRPVLNCEWKLCSRGTAGVPTQEANSLRWDQLRIKSEQTFLFRAGLARARVQRHSGTLLLPPGLSFSCADSEVVLRAECTKT